VTNHESQRINESRRQTLDQHGSGLRDGAHSIAGSVEMFAALLLGDQFTVYQTVRFVSLALAGNLIGGSVFVALLNYMHIRESQTKE